MHLSLLSIDDDEVDQIALRRALKAASVEAEITWVRDAQSGLNALRGLHGASRLPRPVIVLLDLSLPGMSGLEFLRRLRADRRLQDTVVFVRSVSSSSRDIRDAYRYQVAGYVVKSDAAHDTMRLVELLDRYRQIVRLPEDEPVAAHAAAFAQPRGDGAL